MAVERWSDWHQPPDILPEAVIQQFETRLGTDVLQKQKDKKKIGKENEERRSISVSTEFALTGALDQSATECISL